MPAWHYFAGITWHVRKWQHGLILHMTCCWLTWCGIVIQITGSYFTQQFYPAIVIFTTKLHSHYTAVCNLITHTRVNVHIVIVYSRALLQQRWSIILKQKTQKKTNEDYLQLTKQINSHGTTGNWTRTERADNQTPYPLDQRGTRVMRWYNQALTYIYP